MSETKNLKLFKHDNPSINTNTFNVDKALNENWEKIDDACGVLEAKALELDQYIKDCDKAITTLEEGNTTNKENMQVLQEKDKEHDTEIIEIQKNITIQTKTIRLAENVAKETEYTLPISYKVRK